MTNKPNSGKFLDDVKNHRMTVLHDTEIYRSILFRRPDSINMSFTLTTWDNHLCISGDMGCYVFSRIFDMFNFFRSEKPEELRINTGYWAEKLQAISVFGKSDNSKGYLEIDYDGIMEQLREDYAEDKEIIEALDEMFEEDNETRLYDKLSSIGIDDVGERFQYNYTYHYIWCLYAIVWGIQQYDESKTGAL